MTASRRERSTSLLLVALAGLIAGLLAVVAAETKPALALAAVGALGVVALAFHRPVWGVYLALLLVPLETVSAGFTDFALTPAEAVILVTAVAWLARRGLDQTPSLRSPLTLPLLGILLIHVPGLFLAVDQLAVAKELVIWSACYVLFLAVLSDPAPETTRRLAGVIATSGALVALIAVSKSAGSNQVAIDFGGIVTDRATGSFASPVLLAIFVAMTLPLQLVFMLRGRTRRQQVAGLAGALISVSALALALTRSAFIGLAIAGVWLLISWRPARRLLLIVVVLFSAMLVVHVNPGSRFFNTDVLVERISSIASPQTRTARLRFAIWQKAPQVIEDHLPFGIGPDNFPRVAPQYGLISPGVPSNAHNVVLTLATEFGIPGILVVAWLIVAMIRGMRRGLTIPSEPEHSIAVALVASFLAIVVDGMFDYAFSDNVFFLTVILLAALVGRVGRSATAVVPAAADAPPAPVPPTRLVPA